jgi:hypothetical protein
MLGPKPIVVPPRLPWEPIEPDLTWQQKLRAMPRSRWVIMGLSVLMTILIIVGFVLDTRKGLNHRVLQVVMVNSWPASRSTADIEADRKRETAEIADKMSQSRAYIASLPPTKQVGAAKEYNAYLAALKPSQRPADAAPLPVPNVVSK